MRETLAHRFLNRPLALLPSYRSLVLYPDAAGSTASTSMASGVNLTRKPYDVVGGVAVLPIAGALVHGSGFGFGWGETQYGVIRTAFAAALEDAEVAAIALDVDSPGGEVSGCFDLVDTIYAARGVKPIHAICDEMACSAAYALASAADRVLVPRTGLVGSIGVIAFHADVTRALDAAGVKVTTLQFGARKADGAPTTPLTGAAQKRMQADVDAMGELFVATVARNRGLRARTVRDTEAGTFLGRDAVRAGLADAVMAPDDAFLALMDAVTERPAARSSGRAVQRQIPVQATKKVSAMPAKREFSHLRAAAQQPVSAAPVPTPRTLGERHRALLRARGEAVPEPVDALPEQPKRRRSATSTLGERVAALHKQMGRI